MDPTSIADVPPGGPLARRLPNPCRDSRPVTRAGTPFGALWSGWRGLAQAQVRPSLVRTQRRACQIQCQTQSLHVRLGARGGARARSRRQPRPGDGWHGEGRTRDEHHWHLLCAGCEDSRPGARESQRGHDTSQAAGRNAWEGPQTRTKRRRRFGRPKSSTLGSLCEEFPENSEAPRGRESPERLELGAPARPVTARLRAPEEGTSLH